MKEQNSFEVTPRYLTAEVSFGARLRMVAVDSSMVTHVGLCPNSNHLILRYADDKKKGLCYEYEFYAVQAFIDILGAESVGHTIHEYLFNENAKHRGVNYRRRHDLEQQFNEQFKAVDERHLAHDEKIFNAGKRAGLEGGFFDGLDAADWMNDYDNNESFKRVFGFYPNEIQTLDIDLKVNATKKQTGRFFGGNAGLFDAFAGQSSPAGIPLVEDMVKALKTAESYGMMSLPSTEDLDSIQTGDLEEAFGSFSLLGFPARSTATGQQVEQNQQAEQSQSNSPASFEELVDWCKGRNKAYGIGFNNLKGIQ
jgi:hypothetical protein